MAQQPIAAIRDVALVGHGQDVQHQEHDGKLRRGGSQDGCGRKHEYRFLRFGEATC